VNCQENEYPLVSVIIPCFNEEENIPLLAEQVRTVFATLSRYRYECLFVDDGSTDATFNALREVATQDPNIRPLHLVRNSGQSAALVAGLRHARGDLILTLDGDLQNDPCDFPKFLELLEIHDCVCGYRAARHDAWIRRISSRFANTVRNWVLHDGVRDSGCGAKGFHRKCIVAVLPFNGVHRFLPAFFRHAGFSLVESPVTHHPRIHGVSKYGINNRLWRGIHDMVGVAWLRKRMVNPETVETQR